jgi:hypothetical protein
VRLLRTITLDPSDTFVFAAAAEPGEWAVSGAFRFLDMDPAKLEGKERFAFRGGFLGVQSWGWSTLVEVVEATETEREALVEQLAGRLVERLGAPSLGAARIAAEEEVAFAESLCTHPPGTLVAVHRAVKDGDIREAFRTLRRREGIAHGKAFSFVEAADAETADADLSLIDLTEGASRR